MPSMNRSYTIFDRNRIITLDRALMTETVTVVDAIKARGSESRTSVNTPSYQKLKDTRRLPDNPFTYSKLGSSEGSGFIRIESNELAQIGPFKGQSRYITTHLGLPGNGPSPPYVDGPPAAMQAALDRKVVSELLMKIKDQKVNLVQAAAERDMTVRMLADSAMRLIRAVSAMKKGDIVGAGKALGVRPRKTLRNLKRGYHNQKDAIARGWLELQYGWLPLVGDIYGSAEQLAKTYYLPPVEKVVRQRSVLFNRDDGYRESSGLWEYRDHEESELIIKYVCSFTIGNGVTKSLSEIGITNPALIAWELMPWSFVVDWFIPIGTFVSQWDATAGLNFLTGSKTVFLRGKTTRAVTHFRTSSGKATGYTVSSAEKVSHVRTNLGSFPSISLPRFKNPLGFTHLANALALFRTFKGR